MRYEKYGDMVVFDTTYKVNAYDMPCALFVGTNNHGKTVLFGSVLLRNETVHNCRWLSESWCGDFCTLYRMTSIEEFEHNWSSVVAKYNLQNNNHVRLYKIRKAWAPAYLRNHFFGGMTSTSRSESINAFIKRFVSADTSLKDFVKQKIEALDGSGEMIVVKWLWQLGARPAKVKEIQDLGGGEGSEIAYHVGRET
ncbi:protein FAR1-RELATED SEQUENCE 11 [Artemisia annua]|uniref:Protein FAR1-RELATED SEQUENCE n=1 Tax=Artemisia annua TaxID=35608 RepID=A0A2U1KCF0_ARTAN|nr:protein FAR1-RELATED SEQUENCE 11 [Artemisia annua]